MIKSKGLAFVIAAVMGIASAQAAFIVEADNVAPAGKANDHFTATGFSLTTTPSTAVGLSGNQSAFGNPGAAPDIYTFKYTPGTDADNTAFAGYTVLGTDRLDSTNTLIPDPQASSGLAGGASGLYRVFITWPASGNVDPAGSVLTVNSDGAPIVLNVNMNSTVANGPTPIGVAGANKWLNIGTVSLTALTQYTVTLSANNASFVSQRVHAVMWEPAPEPGSLALISVLGVGALLRRRSA